MALFIVTYDLTAPGRNYSGLYDRIRNYTNYAHITESSWAIQTNSTAVQIRDYLAQALDSNDKLFVAPLGAQWAARNLPKEIVDWLNS